MCIIGCMQEVVCHSH